MEQKEIYILILSASFTALVFSITLVTLIVLFQRRKDRYRKEIAQTRIEIKEQTLKNISWEVHDNVGQILSTINLYSYSILESSPESVKPKVGELQELVHQAIEEVRGLSRALNTDYIKNIGLIKSAELELERFKRLNFLETEFKVVGKPFQIPDDTEVILLRILQEFFSNSIRHARASKIEVSFLFFPRKLNLIAKDNGIGFSQEEITLGSGLMNIKNRAKVIGAFLKLDSKPNEGTLMRISYKRKMTSK